MCICPLRPYRADAGHVRGGCTMYERCGVHGYPTMLASRLDVRSRQNLAWSIEGPDYGPVPWVRNQRSLASDFCISRSRELQNIVRIQVQPNVAVTLRYAERQTQMEGTPPEGKCSCPNSWGAEEAPSLVTVSPQSSRHTLDIRHLC